MPSFGSVLDPPVALAGTSRYAALESINDLVAEGKVRRLHPHPTLGLARAGSLEGAYRRLPSVKSSRVYHAVAVLASITNPVTTSATALPPYSGTQLRRTFLGPDLSAQNRPSLPMTGRASTRRRPLGSRPRETL